MMHIKSITMLIVFLMATLMGPTTTHAAVITQDGRQEIIATFIVMIGRAPSQTELADLIAARESGQTLAQVATKITTMTEFSASYPGYMTDDERAHKLVAALIADDSPESAREWSRNWIFTQLQGTKSVAQVIAEAVQAIRATTNTNYSSSKQALSNKVSVAETNIATSTRAASSAELAEKKKAANSALEDLIEIADDLKIEEEDGSDFYKQVLAQSGDMDKPSVTLEKLHALQKKLASATSLEGLTEIQNEITALQDRLNPWVSFAGTNLNESSKNLTDEGMRNIQTINARATSLLTGGGGSNCRSVYNTTTHSYQTVCN